MPSYRTNDVDNTVAALLGRAIRPGLAGVALVSAVLWLLLDTAMAGRSGATVIGLTAMLVVLVAAWTGLSALRARLLRDMSGTTHHIAGPVVADDAEKYAALERLDGLLAGPAVPALINLAGAPLSLLVLLLLGWPMAVVLLASGAAMALVAVVGRRRLQRLEGARADAIADRDQLRLLRSIYAEPLQLLGIAQRFRDMDLYASQRATGGGHTVAAARSGRASAATSVAVLGTILTGSLAVWLVAQDRADIGTVAAAMILTGFVLWAAAGVTRNLSELSGIWTAAHAIGEALSAHRAAVGLVALPAPTRSLAVDGLALAAPGERRFVLRDAAFSATAGDVVAVGGAARVGKSMLLKALAGVVVPVAGKIRMDGSTLDQWDPRERARHIGFLPQGSDLVPGTVGQNIAGFDPAADPRDIIRAAQSAGAHDLIVRLPLGYETPIAFPQRALPQSAAHRIALARACYGDPFLLLLDMPGAFQDSEGLSALSKAIIAARARGAIVIAVGAEPAIVDNANLVLVLGRQGLLDFGPKDEVRDRMRQQRQLIAEPYSLRQSMPDAVAE
jgi:ABC-type protease/lipase transport system fused ATPase/permease subunit